ncbi:MAG: hypothetical protein JXA90_08325 [Planctomycetes bacterium]|nr:hypothetical protein [Planctomycetota bacterium]
MFLLEIMIYTAVLATVMGPIAYLFLAGSRSARENDVYNTTSERSRVALARLARDLRPCMLDTVVFSSTNHIVQFTLPASYDGANIVPGDSVRYVLTIATDEAANGVDDNGNGLVDEGRLVRVNVTTGEVITICASVDLGRSSFVRNGEVIDVNLALSGFLPHLQTPFTVDRSISVRPRN